MKKPDIGDIVKGFLGKPTKRTEREKKIIKIAQERAGRISVLDIVAESSMNTTEVDEILADMAANGHVRMDITEEGAILYVFPGIAERAEREQQARFERELIREETRPASKKETLPSHRSEAAPPARQSSPPPSKKRPKTRRPDVPFPVPSPPSKSTQTVESHHIIFEFCGYERVGKRIICHCRIKNKKHNKSLGISPSAEIYDESATKYPARVQVVDHDARDAIDYLWLSLNANTTFKIDIRANIPLWQVKMIAILELYCKDDILGPAFNVQFHDISLRG